VPGTPVSHPAPGAGEDLGAPGASRSEGPRTAPWAPAAPAADGSPGEVVELAQLSVRFGARPILHQLTARLGGRCIGLLGPNGAGKTTLLHTLLGFHPPSGGTARIFGHDICAGRGEARAIRQLMGYMPETDSFVTGMSGVRFVRLMAELSGLPSEQAMERAHEALFYVGLGEARYRPVESYSLGMKQLAKLAQALVHGPRLLFLDEPTNGLDPPARQRMLELIRDIRDAGEVHVILSSHLLRDVEECCDEVLVLKDGRVAVYANLEEERRANRRFLDLEVRGEQGADAGAAFAAAAAGLGCESAAGTRQRLKLVLPEGVEVRDLYRLAGERKMQIRRLDFKRNSLEDIFLKAMESEGDDKGDDHGGL
jgi:ABC-2 type transport system ATP-binding protein